MKLIFRDKIQKCFFVVCLLLFLGCEDYLDKAPDSDITQEEVFETFIPFQGFVEEMYQCIIDIATRPMWGLGTWTWGDETISENNWDVAFNDNGNYLGTVYNTGLSPFFGLTSTASGPRQKRGYWDAGWYGIRKANIALKNIDDCSSCTEEQKKLLAGQAYFFRAYFHFEILRAWGGIPYIEQVFSPTDEMRYPRLTYHETAKKITEDLKKAAELLPVDWDQTQTGQPYAGQNKLRLTKGAAYGYLGKNLLYAASPLMNGVSTGNYSFDTELCKEAATAFQEVIKLADQGVYVLEPWEKYSDNFYKVDGTVPLGKEIIFSNPVSGVGGQSSRWEFGAHMLNTHGGYGTYASPTENYVEYFGMANGLPIFEPGSGYDPTNPWDNRDPRFYYNILKHGDQLVRNFTSSVPEADRYAQLHVGGRHRSAGNSTTGYGYKKFHPMEWNKFDVLPVQRYFQCPKLRLADIYLMYAEAVNEAFGPTAKPTNIPNGLSSVEAINIVRRRANVPDVDSRFLSNTEIFRDIIWRERAMELAFENHRWYDLRRWYVAHELKYREKYALNFDAGLTYFTKTLYKVKVFDMKHYWLPFQPEQASLYPEFSQNPGW